MALELTDTGSLPIPTSFEGWTSPLPTSGHASGVS